MPGHEIAAAAVRKGDAAVQLIRLINRPLPIAGSRRGARTSSNNGNDARITISINVKSFDIADHRRLPGDLVVERGDPRRVRQTERRAEERRLRQRVVGPQPLDQAGMHDLGVLRELRLEDGDADAPPSMRISARIAVPWVRM